MNLLTGAFRFVLASSVPACVLILLILLVKTLFGRRVSASFHFGIWFLLIFRLVIPFSVASPTSALNLLTPLYALEQSAEPLNPQWTPDLSTAKAAVPPKPADAQPPHAAQNGGSPEGRSNTTSSDIPFERTLAVIWLGGALLTLFYVLTVNLHFIIKLKKCTPVSDARILEIERESRAVLRLSSELPILSADFVASPALYGVLRPKLLIPEQLTGQLSREELKYIILHELAHRKRQDIPVLFLITVVRAFYWFHPLVWYALNRMRQDCEVACDGLVLSRIRPEERDCYGHLLLHLLELGIRRKPAPCAACILPTEKGYLMKRRVVMIVNYKNPRPRRIFLTAVLTAAVAATGLTGAVRIPAFAQAVSSGSVLPRTFDTPIVASAKDAAIDWADALAQRNGAFRFALLSDELKRKEYPDHLQNGWVIGFSSPWVTGFAVRENGQSEAGTSYVIDYTLSDSTRAKYAGSETITVKQAGPTWQVVQHEALDFGYPKITEVPGSLFPKVQEPPATLLPNGTAQGTANLWAEALKERNGAFRFAVLDFDLQKAEDSAYQKMNWVIGGSSPWVVDYTVTPMSPENDTAQYRIDYQLTDSTRAVYHSSETITLKNNGGKWVVMKHDNYMVMPEIK
jgi:beta-lactamase regulating signal transducer with metallopeptidase domain